MCSSNYQYLQNFAISLLVISTNKIKFEFKYLFILSLRLLSNFCSKHDVIQRDEIDQNRKFRENRAKQPREQAYHRSCSTILNLNYSK